MDGGDGGSGGGDGGWGEGGWGEGWGESAQEWFYDAIDWFHDLSVATKVTIAGVIVAIILLVVRIASSWW